MVREGDVSQVRLPAATSELHKCSMLDGALSVVYVRRLS